MVTMLFGLFAELERVDATTTLWALSQPRSAAATSTVRKRLFALITFKVCVWDVPPPGAGFETAIVTGPTVESALAGTNTVARGLSRPVVNGCTAVPLIRIVDD